MTFRVPGPHQPGGGRPVVLPRWPKFVVPTVLIIVAAAILIAIIAGIWTDFLWYRSVHQTRVFGTTYSTKWLLFAITGLFMTVVVGANIWLAYRLRPDVRARRGRPPGRGSVPAGDRPAPARRHDRAARADRPGVRPGRGEQLADLAAVRQPGAVRPAGPAVPPGHLVLRVRLSVPADGPVLPVRRCPAGADPGGCRARPVRRAAAGQARAPVPRCQGAALRAGRHLRRAQGRRLLGGPVRDQLLPARRRADRSVLHRRARRPAGQDGARRDRRDLRGALPGRRGSGAAPCSRPSASACSCCPRC